MSGRKTYIYINLIYFAIRKQIWKLILTLNFPVGEKYFVFLTYNGDIFLKEDFKFHQKSIAIYNL